VNKYKKIYLEILKRLRLPSSVEERAEEMIKDLSNTDVSRHMIFPCDIIDLRRFLVEDKIFFLNTIPFFSLRFSEKYLKEYSLFLVMDSHTGIRNGLYGSLQINYCEELPLSHNFVRIIVNEPAANGSFNVVKSLIEEFKVGVECLVSNSVPGVSNSAYRLSGGNVITHKIAQHMRSDIELSSKEENIFNFLRKVKKDYGLSTQMRVAGGWVRDKLLGKESDDIDIAVDMPGYEFAQLVAEAAVKENITHDPRAYRVSLEKSANPDEVGMANDNLMVGAVYLFGQKIEFVPMRTEHYPDPNSRQPEITTTNDPREDVKRRDLTINAIYYNIDNGEIDDFVGGVNDLGLQTGNMILRTPDETKKTYMEDPLRLLRALRFHSRYPNSILDPEIIKSMADPSIQEAYTKKVATERAGPEIMKLMMGENVVPSLRILFESSLYKNVFDVPSMKNINKDGILMDQKTPWHDNNLLDHILLVVKNLDKIMKDNKETDYMRGLMNLAAMFHDFGKMQDGIQQPHPNPRQEDHMQYLGHERASKKMADEIMKSIGVGRDDRDIVNQIVSLHMRPHDADKWGPKGMGNFLRDTRMHGKDEEHQKLWEYIFYFNKADEMSSRPNNFNEENWSNKYNKVRNFIESPTGSFKGTVVNGRDVMSFFPDLNPSTGYIKEVLDFIKEKQDEGVIDVSGDLSLAKQEAFNQMSMISNDIINKYNGGNKMGNNWFKKIKVSQVPSLNGVEKIEDPEIEKGPVPAPPKYQVGMKVRDRRRGVSQPQEYGKVEMIKGDEVKIVWNPGDKEKRKEEIFNMIEDTEILSMIVAEI